MAHSVKILLVILALLPSLDQLITRLAENYAIGLTLRIFTHIGIPLLWFYFRREKITKAFEPLKCPDKKITVIYSIIGVTAAAIAIIGLFFLLKQFMDFSQIQQEIAQLYPLTLPVYIAVGLSISLINPFIEEFFWRGFIFKEYNKRGGGYWTGIIFALHHAIMLASWFTPLILAIATVGLAVVGVLFNWVCKKTQSLYAILITHAAADITIVIIGYFVLFS